MRGVLSALLCAASWGYPATGFARGPDPIELEWNAPEGCPASDKVLERVRQIAGKTRSSVVPLKAEATVTQRADGWFQLRLLIRAGELQGVRSVEGRSCDDLVGAVAVALAILMSSEEPLEGRDLEGQPSTAAGAGERSGDQPTTPPAREPPATPPAAPNEPSEPSGPSGPTRRWHGLFTLPLAALSLGPQSRAAGGLGVAAGVSFDRWRFRAEGKLWAAQNVTTALQADEYGAKLERYTVTLRGCRALWGSRFEIAPCALASLQHLSAEGRGPHIAPQTPGTTWMALGVGLQSRLLVVSWLSLILGVDGEVQLSRPEVKLDGVGLVERFSPFAGTLMVGSEWIL